MPENLTTLLPLVLALSMVGCGQPVSRPTAGHPGPEIATAMAKLSDEDRPLAEAQGYCAVTAEPLGSMGPPIKLVVNGQPAFVCCKGCERKAKADPDKTIAKVAELKAKVKSESSH